MINFVRKRIVFFTSMMVIAFAAYPQAMGEETGRGDGFTATIAVTAEAFNLRRLSFEHSGIRGPQGQDGTVTQFMIYNQDFSRDASASIEYKGSFYGGKFGFQPQVVSGSTTFGGLVNAWVRFGFLRFTIGNDIETTWSNELGADPGLRIYDGNSFNSYVKPENITKSSGLLAEASLGDLSIALAAGDFLSKLNFTSRITNGLNDDNEYRARYDSKFRYGAHAGYQMGALGNLNLSYLIEEKTVATSYEVRGGNSSELVAIRPDARVFDHLFGLYGSLRLARNLDLTVGYNGMINAMLKEFHSVGIGMIETGHPIVFRHGVNLNARWKINDNFALRTDNSLTFWQDKNYELFQTGRANWNYNIQPKRAADSFASVNYFVLWNGLGTDFNITGQLSGTVYLRNLLSRYSASGWTPWNETANPLITGKQSEYVFLRNEIQLKLGLTYHFSANAKAFVELAVENLVTSRSKDLNAQTNNFFVDRVNNRVPDPVATLDNEFVVRIPIGITLTLR